MNDAPEEAKLLLRDMRQAARTLLDVQGGWRYGVAIFKLCLEQEALNRSHNNRCHAAELLGIHRNTITRNTPLHERKAQERYSGRKRAQAISLPARINLHA